jgi:hypothetical protein
MNTVRGAPLLAGALPVLHFDLVWILSGCKSCSRAMGLPEPRVAVHDDGHRLSEAVVVV